MFPKPEQLAKVKSLKQLNDYNQTNELLAVADAWFVTILLQDSIGNEKCHLPDVQFGTVFIDLVTYSNQRSHFKCCFENFWNGNIERSTIRGAIPCVVGSFVGGQ